MWGDSVAKDNEDVQPERPLPPEPFATPDGVSPQMRRAGGYAWRLIAICLIIAGLVWLIAPLQTLLLALFFALLVGAWLMPLTNKLAKRMPRWVAGVIALLVFTIALLVIIFFIGLSAIQQFSGIGTTISEGVASLDDWLRNGPLNMSDADLSSAYASFQNFIRESGGNIALGVLSGLGSIVGLATAAAAGFFVLIFVLIQPVELFGWITRWIPARHREVSSQSIRIGWNAFSQYSRGILLVAMSNAVLVTILLLIMGVPLAVPLGVIVFFGAFIPYIGAPLAMLLAAAVAFISNGVLAGVLVLVLIAVIGQIEGNVLQPLILGHSVSLHPVAIVLVTAVAAAYFGIIGALIGVPIAAAIYGIMKYVRGPEAESSQQNAH
jgi:predicted PurR-regulated permease PerM